MIRPIDRAEARRLSQVWWDLTVPVDDACLCRVEKEPGHKVIAHTSEGTLVVPLVYAAELAATDPERSRDGVCLPQNFLWHRTCACAGCIAHAVPLPAWGGSSHAHSPQEPARSAHPLALEAPATDAAGRVEGDGGAGMGINAPRLDSLRPIPGGAKQGMRYARKNHNRARFSDDEAREILRLRYREGWTYSLIAARFDAPLPTIVGLCRGKTYRDLLPPDVLARARQRRDDREAQHA